MSYRIPSVNIVKTRSAWHVLMSVIHDYWGVCVGGGEGGW